jgi:biotin carboxyl carrier protein
MALTIRLGDRAVAITAHDEASVEIDDVRFSVEAIDRGIYRVSDGASHWTVAVAGPPESRWVSVEGQTAVVDVSDDADRGGRTRRRTASDELTAPMPATVTKLLVAPQTAVKAGDVLMMLEAMKMELAIRAPQDGTVGAIHCKVGDLVQPGVALLDFA